MQPVFLDSYLAFCQYPIFTNRFSNEFSKTNIVLTMSATKVDAIVRVVGVYGSPSTVVSAFKGLLLMSNC